MRWPHWRTRTRAAPLRNDAGIRLRRVRTHDRRARCGNGRAARPLERASAALALDQHALDAARIGLRDVLAPSSRAPADSSRSRRRCSRPWCPHRRRSATVPAGTTGTTSAPSLSPSKPSARSASAPLRHLRFLAVAHLRRDVRARHGQRSRLAAAAVVQRDARPHQLVDDGQRRVGLHRRVAGVVVHVANAGRRPRAGRPSPSGTRGCRAAGSRERSCRIRISAAGPCTCRRRRSPS